MPYPLNVDGTLIPPVLSPDPDAKKAWVDYYDEIEREMRDGGELHDVRDVASKSADNAARLAALFHIFREGPIGVIGTDDVESATRISAWNLS
ncbi:MAG: DUF3987 domain-containing protein [Methylococcaceae bacterium]|nr:DUF3987 domain-containing protein [Methylococcaceae bacterium]